MENTILIVTYFFQLEEGSRRGNDQKLFTEDLDLISESICFFSLMPTMKQKAVLPHEMYLFKKNFNQPYFQTHWTDLCNSCVI